MLQQRGNKLFSKAANELLTGVCMKKNTRTIIIVSVVAVLLACAVVLAMACVLLFGYVVIVVYIGIKNNIPTEVIVVNSINSRHEIDKDISYYFYSSDNAIYAYSFAEEETINILQEDLFIDDFAVYDQWILYLLEFEEEDSTREELWRYNRTTDEKEMIFEDIDCSYIETFNGYFLYDDNDIDYVCPVDKNPNDGSVPWMEMFEENKLDGNEQFIFFNGMTIGRYYDKESDTYHITCIREEASGRRIVPWDLYGPRLLIDDDWYSILDRKEDIKYEVMGHNNTWDIVENQLTVEDGRIVGILTEFLAPSSRQDNVSQYYIGDDFLFEINLKTNKISTIYSTNGSTRIIGYEDGLVYLLDDKSYKVSVNLMDEDGEEELFEIPKQDKIFIDWSNDHIIVHNKETVILIYSVEKGRVTYEDT